MSNDVTQNTPLVSIIIATYRRDTSLKKAIQSLITQTYSNIEIIVVDDNANTEWNKKVEDIISSFSNEKRLNYIQNKSNMGSAKTRNIGIDAAKGEYITFLDDDDIYLPPKVENQLNGMLKNNADYSLTDLDLYNDNETLSEHRSREFLIDAKKEDLIKYHLMYHLTGTDTMMFKRKYLIDIDKFDLIDVGDEFYLMQKAILKQGLLYYLPKSDVKAYVHTGESGLSSGQNKIEGENKLYNFKKNFFDKLDGKTKRYISMRHYAVLGFAYLRMKKYGGFFINGIKSFICSPSACVKLILNRKKI